MTFSYVLTTDIGKVRRLVGKLETEAATALFTDEEITQELVETAGSIPLAAANLKDQKADYIVEKKKVTTIGKYSINGAAMAAELRKGADRLRQNVEDDGSFDVAETDQESLV
nr:hypothetical protein [uncultured Methanoregula sp.]